MRIIAAVAGLAALFVAVPAAAQGRPAEKEPVQTFKEKEVAATTTAHASTAAQPADPENTWVLDLSSGGRVIIRLRPDVAPKMVEQVKTLTRRKFYDNTIFHRVVDTPENMAQGGDPTGTGRGESDLPDVPAEFNNLPHVRGAVSAARTQDPNSANSQFFIMFGPKLGFDYDYTVFGRVVDGMQWVDKIERGEPPARPTRILHAYILADNPPPYAPAPVTVPAAEEPTRVPQ